VRIVIAGVSGGSGFKGPATMATTPSATQFTFLSSTASGSGTGGTVGAPDPITADSLGNFFFLAVPGGYTAQIHRPQVATSYIMQGVTLPCDTSAACGPSRNNSWVGASTFANINDVVYVDGVRYAFTATGIQSAINAACNGAALGAVVIPPATISLGRTGLGIPNNCDVGGSGQASTTLTLSSSATTTHLSNAAASPTNIRIHDVTLDGSSGTSPSEGCLAMNGSTSPTDITVERITCQNVGGSGINVSGSASNPGQRIRIVSNKILNAGLATGSAGQIYGIVVSFNSHVYVADNEIGNGALTTGITAFSSINASSSTPIIDIQYIGNRIHDLPFHTTTGGAMDIGRAKHVVAANNVVWNMAQGACVVFEAVWYGSITGNSCNVADAVLTGGPIVIKTPDTTQSGEVASQNILITGNSIGDNSTAADVNGDITVNGAERKITISGNVISHLTQSTTGGSPILLQLGTSDSNISASGQNFCNLISVTGNRLVNRPGSSGASAAPGISIAQQTTSCAPDQIVVAKNTITGFGQGIGWGAQANNGITNLEVHDNVLDGNGLGLNGDGKSYRSVCYYKNLVLGRPASQITKCRPRHSAGPS
jgi:hypothetical protein